MVTGGVALDALGRAHVVGGTLSIPTTAGAFDGAPTGFMKGFVLRLRADGGALDYGTYSWRDVGGQRVHQHGDGCRRR